MLGWGVPTMDSHYVFHYLTRPDRQGRLVERDRLFQPEGDS